MVMLLETLPCEEEEVKKEATESKGPSSPAPPGASSSSSSGHAKSSDDVVRHESVEEARGGRVGGGGEEVIPDSAADLVAVEAAAAAGGMVGEALQDGKTPRSSATLDGSSSSAQQALYRCVVLYYGRHRYRKYEILYVFSKIRIVSFFPVLAARIKCIGTLFCYRKPKRSANYNIHI